ncbi:MAG: hypothetical protein ACR5LD_07320 [Symbiopectobacterium sp.]
MQFAPLRFVLDDIDLLIQQRQFLRRGQRQHTRQDISRYGELLSALLKHPVISKANSYFIPAIDGPKQIFTLIVNV